MFSSRYLIPQELAPVDYSEARLFGVQSFADTAEGEPIAASLPPLSALPPTPLLLSPPTPLLLLFVANDAVLACLCVLVCRQVASKKLLLVVSSTTQRKYQRTDPSLVKVSSARSHRPCYCEWNCAAAHLASHTSRANP